MQPHLPLDRCLARTLALAPLLLGAPARAQDTSAPPPAPDTWVAHDQNGRRIVPTHWKDLPIRPKARDENTAYPLGRGVIRVGLFNQTWGVLDNAELSTNTVSWALGLPNVGARVTAIQTRYVDVSVQAGITSFDLERLFDVPGGRATLIPVGWTGSLTLADPLSVHLGTTWNILDATGSYTTTQLAQGIAQATGVQLDPALLDILANIDSGSDIYAGAHVILTQSHLDGEIRINRRDSLILRTTSFVNLQGTIQGGYQTTQQGDGGVQAQIGPSARLSIPLKDQVSVLASISYQASWRRLHLRVGVPIPIGTTWLAAIPQAVSIHWLLGKVPHELPAAELPTDQPPADQPPAPEPG